MSSVVDPSYALRDFCAAGLLIDSWLVLRYIKGQRRCTKEAIANIECSEWSHGVSVKSAPNCWCLLKAVDKERHT